jgi:hypothetical protein
MPEERGGSPASSWMGGGCFVSEGNSRCTQDKHGRCLGRHKFGPGRAHVVCVSKGDVRCCLCSAVWVNWCVCRFRRKRASDTNLQTKRQAVYRRCPEACMQITHKSRGSCVTRARIDGRFGRPWRYLVLEHRGMSAWQGHDQLDNGAVACQLRVQNLAHAVLTAFLLTRPRQ